MSSVGSRLLLCLAPRELLAILAIQTTFFVPARRELMLKVPVVTLALHAR